MNNVLLDIRQTPFDGLPAEPVDGDTHTLKWTNYIYIEVLDLWVSDGVNTYFQFVDESKTWELKDPTDLTPLLLVTCQLSNDLAGRKALALESEIALDIQKNDLEHRIYVQKTIVLQHGTEEEFADYFSQLDAMLEADDPMQVNFPPAPFQE
jgi:hypothetical protein